MIKLFQNIYQAENHFEQTSAKKCCKATVIYLVKCEGCEELVCHYHCKSVKRGKKWHLVCFSCFWKE